MRRFVKARLVPPQERPYPDSNESSEGNDCRNDSQIGHRDVHNSLPYLSARPSD